MPPKRSRNTRSASPTKMPPPSATVSESPAKGAPTPNRPKISPKKRLPKKATPTGSDSSSSTKKATTALQEALSDSPPVVGTVELTPDDIDADADVDADAVVEAVDTIIEQQTSSPDGVVRVTINSEDAVDEEGESTTRTTVQVEMPADSPDLKLPETTEGVLKEAEKIVESAKEIQAGSPDEKVITSSLPSKKNHKRKVSEMLDAEGPEEVIEELVPATSLTNGDVIDEDGERATKRTRVMVAADEYRRERIQKRALLGLSASLVIGAAIPFVANLF